MVSPLGFLFRLALGGDDRADRFRGVQPGCHVGQDACETHVVLWSRLGRRGEVEVCPTTEPDAPALVRAKREWIRDDLWRLDFNDLEEVKSPQVIAALLSLCADKRRCVWFCRWTDFNLPTLPKLAPQDHMGLTGVLTDVATRLHTAEAIRPVVAT